MLVTGAFMLMMITSRMLQKQLNGLKMMAKDDSSADSNYNLKVNTIESW